MTMRLIGGAPFLVGLMALGGCANGVPGGRGSGVDLGAETIAFAEPAAPLAGFDPLDDDLIRDPASSYDLDIPLQPDLGPRPEVLETSQEAIEADLPFAADPFSEEPSPVPDDLSPGAVTSWFDLDGSMEDVPLADLDAEPAEDAS